MGLSRYLFLYTLLLLISSCGKLNLSVVGKIFSDNNRFIGFVPKFSGLVSTKRSSLLLDSAYASGCAKEDVVAELYLINDSGVIESSPLDQTSLKSDASFEFDFKKLGLSLTSKIDYTVKVTGCDLVFVAPVLQLGERQIIDSRTTFVAASVNSDAPVKLKDVSREEVRSLIAKLSGETVEEVKSQIVANTPATNQYQKIFGITPVIVDVAPIVGLSIPKNKIPEDQAYAFNPVIESLDASYAAVYEWKLDNVIKAQTLNWSYRPSKNDQGIHTISFKVGANDGSGNIDSTRPYYLRSFQVTVDNTFFPIAPNLIIADAFVKTTSITVDFDKGDCTTFSKLAITTSATPSASDFIYTCADSAVGVTLSTGDGVKTVYIHSQDDHGDTSSGSSATLTLDTLPPTLNSNSALLSGGMILSGLRDELIPYVAVDSNLGPAPMSFEYSTNSGVSWIGIAQNIVSGGSYLWNLPNIDASDVRFRIIARDLAGNEAILTSSSNFVIDSTPPSTLNATLQGTHTNSNLITATVGSCSTDQAYMLMNESALTPAVSDSSWSSCSTSLNSLTHTLINSTNGTKTLYLWAKDLAGNISTSVTRTIIYDSTPPVIALTTPAGNSYINDSNKSAVSFTGTCSENGVINVSGAVTTTMSCAGGVFSSLLNFVGAAEGDLVISLNQTDLAGNSATAVNVSLKKDTGIPTVAITAPASGSFVNIANQSSFTLSGNCSEDGRDVAISGAVSATTPCSAGAFSTNLNLTSISQGAVTLIVNHSDLAGNNATASSRSFTKDSIAPTLTQTTSGGYKNTNTVTFSGSCENGATIAVTGADLSSATCSGNSWSYTTQVQNSDATYSYTFTHTDPAGNSSEVNASWIRETVLPEVQSVLIAEGAEFVGTSFVVVDISATDNKSVSSVRLKNAHSATKECQSEYADDSWQAYAGGVQRYSIAIPPGDGEKKVCVWAKDHAGNISEMTSLLGTLGVDMDTVRYEIGNPPKVIAFDVKNGSNGTSFGLNVPVYISWTVTDQEELAENPISLWYTTSSAVTANWTPITLNYGSIGTGQLNYTDTLTTFKSPSAGYFRVKIVAKDSAGNTSLSSEKTLNTGNWSVFAGTTDSGVEGSALGLRLKFSTNNAFGQYAAIDPETNDTYVVSYGEGIYKLNAVTGKTEVFIKHGAINLSDGGVIDNNSALSSLYLRMMFDNNGYLYVMEPPPGNSSHHAIIWQINLRTKGVKKYLGGGNIYNGSAEANTAYVQYGHFTFDESNSLYYFAICSPGSAYNHPSTIGVRLMKATQNTQSKEVEDISVVAGDCSVGNPTASVGVDPLNNPLSASGYVSMGNVAAWENGNKIYYRLHGSGASFKILNGVTYRSGVEANLYYDQKDHSLYAGSTNIRKITLNTTGSGGDSAVSYIEGSGIGDCLKDGVHRLAGCISTVAAPIRGPNGRLAFLDGLISNASGTYRLRYIDDAEEIRTYLGTPPFYGEGLDKSFLKSDIGGIYYKKSSEPNQTAFSEGLYFGDGNAMVMGKIDVSSVVSLIAGNQSRKEVTVSTGVPFDTSLSLGVPYGAGKLMSSLTFNNEGLPYFRVASTGKSFMKVESNLTVTFKTASSVTSNYFDEAATGANPANFGGYVYGGVNNLVIKDENKLFLLGAYVSATTREDIVSSAMKIFDYGSITGVTHIMGATKSSSAVSVDDATGGNLAAKTFSSVCHGSSSCFLQYHNDEDRIYFSEGTHLRYITTPEVPATSTLGTLLTASRDIRNFIFSEDGKQIFYISSGGNLYCKDISSGKAWCDDSSLGPTAGMSVISSGPNQLTWKDANTLLISTYTGMIYQYNLLP